MVVYIKCLHNTRINAKQHIRRAQQHAVRVITVVPAQNHPEHRTLAMQKVPDGDHARENDAIRQILHCKTIEHNEYNGFKS
jgi:hypothetical protein